MRSGLTPERRGAAVANNGRMTTPDFATVEHWLDQGLYLQVHPHLDRLAASSLPGERLQAVRALRYLGADRAGEALLVRTGRRFAHDGAAVAAHWRGTLSRRGPYLAGELMRRLPMPAGADAAARAEGESTRMRLAAALRDFDLMRRHRDAVRSLDDSQPWLWMEWAYSCLDADRTDEAIEATAQALALQPGFRAALMMQATLHEQAGRTAEACALLQQALAERECGAFGQQLWPWLMEAGDFVGADAVLDRIEALWPRADAGARGWLAARRADVASRAGDRARAREAAARVPGTGFYSRLAERLGTTPVELVPPRTMLPVPFVRQNWMTCAPATLTALSSFWGRPVDHLEVAEAICYDGTAHASERQWALDAGWIVREFTADAAITTALVEAGVPFTVTTSEVASAHLQAVIGVDRLRQTLIVRDPTEPSPVEYEMGPFFERYRATGPRAMLLLPPHEAGRLEGLVLPDVDAWDVYFALMAALARHDRDAAQAAVATGAAARPGHWLQRRTERALALYDGDEPAILAATEQLLALFPDDGHLRLSKAASLWAIGGREQHREWLAACAQGPWPDSLTRVRLTDRLIEDERRLPEAASLLRRVLWRSPALAEAWSTWADIVWRQGDRAAALPRYRAAATLRTTSEGDAATYARALRMDGDRDAAVAHLQRRVERLGAQSGEPAQTLFDELEAQDRAAEGFEALAEARRRRPADGALAVFSVEAELRYGRLDEARAVLAGVAAGAASQAAILRARSRLAEAEGDIAEAQRRAREAVALSPLNLDLWRLLLRQIDRLQGREAVIAELQQALQRFPRFVGLQRLLYDWLPRGDARELAQLDALAALHPGDAWAQRERALVLTQAHRFDEALAAAAQAVAVSPGHSASHAVLGSVTLERDGYDAARPHLERAVALDVDHDYALRTLVSAAPDAARAQSALAFIATELARQPTQGDVLLTYQAWAQDHLSHAALLQSVGALQAVRPQLWQGWVALARTLAAGDAPEVARAEQLLADAVRRFPTVAQVALDHALRLAQLQRRDEARRALEPALTLNPSWNRAVRLMVDLIDETDDDWLRAERLLQRALALAPADADLRSLLGWVLEQAGRHAEALAVLEESLAQDAEPEWVWKTAERCADALRQPHRFVALIDAVARRRPADPWPRIVRARQTSDHAEALAASEEALQLNPRLVAAWHERFRRLLDLQRGAEVQQRAGQLPWPDGGPAELRAYAAQAQRAAGEPAAAKAALQVLLKDAPHEHGLWLLLADWHDEDDEHEAYVRAAREMVRLTPNDARSQVYLGHALAKFERHADALEPLQRALALAPGHRFAGLQLADSALASGRPALAEQALEALWPHSGTFDIAARGCRVAARQADREALRRWFARALASTEHEAERSRELVLELRREGLAGELEPLQRAALQAGRCALGAGVLWFEDRAEGRRRAQVLDEAEALMRNSEGAAAPRALLHWLVRVRDLGNLRSVLATWRERYRGDDSLWGDAAWAWLQLGEAADVIRWLEDWRERPSTPAWVLTNLCVALATEARYDSLAEASAAALRQSPFDIDAQLWQAVAAATQGDRARVRDAMQALERQPLEPWMKPLMRGLRAWLSLVWDADRAAARQGLVEARALAGRDVVARRFLAWLMVQIWQDRLPRWLLGLMQRLYAR